MNIIRDNADGCTWNGWAFPVTFDHNDIFGNNDLGVRNDNPVTAVSAPYNWWGHATGPSGVGTGLSDGVSANVNYTPFLTFPVRAEMVVDLCLLLDPIVFEVWHGRITPEIQGWVYEAGTTEDTGPGPGITAELGYGADGSYPQLGTWVWQSADYYQDQGDYDEYQGTITVTSPGDYDFCYRFSLDGGETWVYADHDGNDLGGGGDNGYSVAETGSLLVHGDSPLILLVVDGPLSLQYYFTDALNGAGLIYDVWDNGPGSPALSDLEPYNIVIWTTAMMSTGTLLPEDEDLLAQYLEGGGRLFLSSQGYLTEVVDPTDFTTSYLHVTAWANDVGTLEVESDPSDPIGQGMGLALFPPLFCIASDNVTPDPSAAVVFTDVVTVQPSAVRFPLDDTFEETSPYRVVFFAFPFEAIPDLGDRTDLLTNIVEWLMIPSAPWIPELLAPGDSTVTDDDTPTFFWSPGAGSGGRYTLYYGIDDVFPDEATMVENITDIQYTVPVNTPLPDTTYAWCVQAVSAEGQVAPESDPFQLVVDCVPEVPVLHSPGDSTVVSDSLPSFVWSSTAREGGTYVLEYSPDEEFDLDVVTVAALAETTYTVIEALNEDTYHWRVNAVTSLGYESGYQAESQSFVVDWSSPAVPALVAPGDLAGINDPTPTFSWEYQPGESRVFTLECALDSNFTTGVTTHADLAETTYTFAEPLPDDTYYWHVEAVDDGDNHSGYQPHPFSFILDTQSPAVPELVLPADSLMVDDFPSDFMWSATADSGGTYTLQYAVDRDFTDGLWIIYDIPQNSFISGYPFEPLVNTVYNWRVEAVDISDNHSGFQVDPFVIIVGTVGVDDLNGHVPGRFFLSPNYPNPFNAKTMIHYGLPRDCHVELEIYDLRGQRVATLIDERQEAGNKMILWDGKYHSGRSVASGVYLYRLQAGDFVKTHKMILIK